MLLIFKYDNGQILKFLKASDLLTSNFVGLALYLTHILMNYLELGALQYFYYVEVAFFFIIALRKPWPDLLFPTLIFFFIEGQGRILTNYNPIFRNIFDIYLVVIFLKSIIKDKKLIDFKTTPTFFTILIALHFIWYFVQFFNYQSVGVIGVFFASKIYVLPILIFLMFLRNKMDLKAYNQDKLLGVLLVIILAQVFLIFHQMSLQESHLLSISPYYKKVMGERFVGSLFRPFGTSFVPGGISVHFAYISAFLIFTKSSFRLAGLFKIIAILGMIFACFTMQVRTSLIQLLLIVFSSYFILAFTSRLKLILIPAILSSLLIIPIAIESSEKLDEMFPKLNLGYSIRRLQVLQDLDQIKSQRADLGTFYNTLTTKLEKTPMGLGPGRTGAANSMFVNRINADLLFDMRYSWTLDNLFISLAIDLGYGMIFYSLLIIFLPLYLFAKIITVGIRRRELNQTALVCSLTTIVILLSNWGAIAIPYNPVSFFFWFYLSVIIIELRKDKLTNPA